jgi:hypothetical protein
MTDLGPQFGVQNQIGQVSSLWVERRTNFRHCDLVKCETTHGSKNILIFRIVGKRDVDMNKVMLVVIIPFRMCTLECVLPKAEHEMH